MTDELIDFDEELEQLCAEIRKGIDGLKKVKPADRAQKVQFLEGRINRAKNVFRSFKVELRDLSKAQADPYQKKAKDYNELINKLIQDLNWIQDNGELEGVTKEKDLDNMSTEEVLKKAVAVQDDSLKTLDRTIQTIEETKQVGAETAAALASQTEQLKRVGEGVEEVQANLKQANKQLRAFVRRMATDKIIMGFMCLIVLGIIILIVVRIVKGKKKNNSDTFNP